MGYEVGTSKSMKWDEKKFVHNLSFFSTFNTKQLWNAARDRLKSTWMKK